MEVNNNTSSNLSPGFVRPRQAAAYLDISVELLAKWRRMGIGPRVRKAPSRVILYAVADLQSFMDKEAV